MRCYRELCRHLVEHHLDGGPCWIVGCECGAMLTYADVRRARARARYARQRAELGLPYKPRVVTA